MFILLTKVAALVRHSLGRALVIGILNLAIIWLHALDRLLVLAPIPFTHTFFRGHCSLQEDVSSGINLMILILLSCDSNGAMNSHRPLWLKIGLVRRTLLYGPRPYHVLVVSIIDMSQLQIYPIPQLFVKDQGGIRIQNSSGRLVSVWDCPPFLRLLLRCANATLWWQFLSLSKHWLAKTS